MNFSEKHIQLIEYLDLSYIVKEELFFSISEDIPEWGEDICEYLAEIFIFETDFCKNVLTEWANTHGMTKKQFDAAWKSKKLKTTWSVELAQDLAMFHNIDIEAELTALLAEQVANEIDAQILRDVREIGVKTRDELISVVKCLGHEATEPEYDTYSGRKTRGFKPISFEKMKNERQNNDIWKNYFRPTGLDQKT